MANWNNPTVSSNYTDFVDEVKGRDTDLATMFDSGTPSNIPTGAIKWASASNVFQKWNGASFDNLVLGIAGGGTGASTAAAARTALGLGTMATQNSSAVTITGGTVTGITLAASTITSGEIALARGGTGASLALGGAGTVLGSTGAAVAFIAGTSIAALNASNLSTGTIPDARFPATLPAASGVNLTALNASNLGSGNVPVARMPTGGTWSLTSALTMSFAATFGLVVGAPTGGNKGTGTVNAQGLYVDGVAVSGGGGAIPSGLIAIFDTACPSGWTRVVAWDNKFLRGGASYGATGGSDTHYHGVDFISQAEGGHTPTGSVGTTDVQPTGDGVFEVTGAGFALTDLLNPNHSHGLSMDPVGNHTHSIEGSTDNGSTLPAYITVVFCKKD